MNVSGATPIRLPFAKLGRIWLHSAAEAEVFSTASLSRVGQVATLHWARRAYGSLISPSGAGRASCPVRVRAARLVERGVPVAIMRLV
jgi:hypothetical protein